MPAVQLLHSPHILFEGKKLYPPKGKTSALLYYLAYTSGWVKREDILYLFWPDLEDSKARANLRQLIRSLKKLPYCNDLEITDSRLQWDVTTDVESFLTAIQNDAWANATELYHGPLLKGLRTSAIPEFEQWLEIEKQRLLTSYLESVRHFSSQLITQERHKEATQVLHKALEQEPLDKDLLESYIKSVSLTEGETGAKKALEAFQNSLEQSLGFVMNTQDLNNILTVATSNTAVQKTTAILDSPAINNLPNSNTEFLGRQLEKEQLSSLLANKSTRLITIWAMGGMGKTRLAIAVAQEQIELYQHGACFVAFASLDNPHMMLYQLADALGFQFYGKESTETQLFNFLANKNMLLILDNLEHILESTYLIGKLLEAAPHLQVITTSREILNLQAEHIFELKGLSFTNKSDAKELFVSVAKRRIHSFKLNKENSDYIDYICELVRGMPLALELAASWLTLLSPQAIVEELEKNLVGLEGQHRDIPTRHNSLQSVFEYSWSLLSDAEKIALAKLSIFRGGFSREAAQTIAQANLAMLATLRNKSFVQVLSNGRYEQHSLVLQYTSEKFAGLEQTPTLEQFANYYLELGRNAKTKLQQEEQLIWLARIQAEHDNFLSALNWSLETKNICIGYEIALSLFRYWEVKGLYKVGQTWLQYFLDADKTLACKTLRAAALNTVGVFFMYQGNFLDGNSFCQQALDLATKISDKETMAWALHDLANFASHQNDYLKAKGLNEESLMLFSELEHAHGIAYVLNQLATNAHAVGDYEQAEALYQKSLKMFQDYGDDVGIASALNNLGFVYIDQSRYDKAKLQISQAYSLNQKLLNQRGIAASTNHLGLVAYGQKEYVKAKELYLRSLLLHQELGALSGVAYGLFDIAVLLCDLKDYKQSLKLIAAALTLKERINSTPDPMTSENIQRCIDLIKSKLSPETYSTLWNTGKSLSIQEAIELAQSQT